MRPVRSNFAPSRITRTGRTAFGKGIVGSRHRNVHLFVVLWVCEGRLVKRDFSLSIERRKGNEQFEAKHVWLQKNEPETPRLRAGRCVSLLHPGTFAVC